MPKNLTQQVLVSEAAEMVYVTSRGIVYDAVFSLTDPHGICGEYVPIVVE